MKTDRCQVAEHGLYLGFLIFCAFSCLWGNRMKDPRERSSGLYSSSFTLHLSFMLRLHYILFEKRSLGGDTLLCRLSKLSPQIFNVMTTFYYFQSTSTYTLSYGSLKILVHEEGMLLWYLWSRIWLLMMLIHRIKLCIIIF